MSSWVINLIILAAGFHLSCTLPQMKSIPADDLYLEFTDILNQTMSKQRQDANGYTEHIMAHNGVIGLERTASDESDATSLRFHEVTNGSIIVQLIFSPKDTLADCDILNSRHHIRRLLKHVASKRYSHKYNPIASPADDEAVGNLTDLPYWISHCNNLHTHKLDIKTQPGEQSEEESKNTQLRKRIQGSAMDSTAERAGRGEETGTLERQKRGLMDLIYPGTKWCGKGSNARHYYDLGEMKHTDRCCREHDMCATIIPALSTDFHYFNYGLITLSSCKCDNQFKQCLQKAAYKHDDAVADMVGHLYFNVIGMQCFNVQEKDYCVETSWWGRCLKSERQNKACFDQMLTY